MKTVRILGLADASNAAGLPDLPEEITLAMADIAGPGGAVGDERGRRAGGDGRDVRGRDRRGVRGEGQA
jgi:hypothetical protein